MNKRSLLALAGLLLLSAGLSAQSFFQNYYAYPGYAVQTGAVVQLSGGQIAVGGQLTNEQSGQTDAAILLLSSTGTLLWARQLDAAGQPDLLKDLEATPDGKILAVMGKTFISQGYSGLIKMDLNGTIEWSKQFSGTAEVLFNITKLSSGYLLTGVSAVSQHGLVLKIDDGGQEFWRKTVEWPAAVLELHGAWEDTQGFLYIAGSMAQKDGVLLKLNTAGDLLWARRLGTPEEDVLLAVIPLPGGKLMLGGISKGADQFYKVWLTQTDLDGAVKWSSTFGQSAGDVGLQDLAATGLGPVFTLSGLGATPNPGTALARVNDSGDLLWIKNYDPPAQFARTPRLAPGPNNGLIAAAGLQTGSGTGFLVVHADTNGDVPPCCFKSGNLAVVDITIENQVFIPERWAAPGMVQGLWTATAFQPQQSSLCLPAHAEIALSDSVICPGECVDLIIVDPTPGASYSWSYPGGVPAPAPPNRICFPAVTKDVLITLFANNCPFQQDTALLRVDAAEEKFPNAFTPNGDDANNIFLPLLYCPVSQYHFQVFNRWGELMFETFDPAQGWDGTFNGLEAPSDVYGWVVQYQSAQSGATGIVQKKGNVTLLR